MRSLLFKIVDYLSDRLADFHFIITLFYIETNRIPLIVIVERKGTIYSLKKKEVPETLLYPQKLT